MNNKAIDQVISKQVANTVLDRKFSYFVEEEVIEPATILSIEDFFSLYKDLFYLIPKEGESNSHRSMLIEIAQYLNVQLITEDYQELLEEVTSLRELTNINVEKLGV